VSRDRRRFRRLAGRAAQLGASSRSGAANTWTRSLPPQGCTGGGNDNAVS
jgi:hypothetical protein